MELQIIKLPWKEIDSYRGGSFGGEIHGVWKNVLRNIPKEFHKYIKNESPKLEYATHLKNNSESHIPYRFTFNSKIEELERFLENFVIYGYWKTDYEHLDWKVILQNLKLAN